jgi:ClpP class serine protease
VTGKAADWILGQPWAITEEALGVILSIAERANESPEAVEARLGRPLDNTHETTVRDGVALIPVVGPISRHADLFSRISGATAIETLARDFRTALDDRSVRAIVLNMDSPGGTVSGVSEFAGHVLAARGTKPIVAYVGSQAASAAYWIASAADRVVADSTATLGSIGVVMGIRKPADAKAGQARTVEFVSSQSPRKRPDPDTEAGRAQVQAVADDLADVFVDAVAAHRGVARAAVLEDFGRGGVLVGSKAVDAGMADGLGSLERVVASLSRGEMPWERKPPKPAPKAESNPRRAAMSEPNANEPTITAAEAVELRRQVAEANRRADEEARRRAEADARGAAATRQAIDDRAAGFATEVLAACKAVPAERPVLVSAFTQAALDDHQHPIAGRPAARQDQVRAIYESRTRHNLTEEVGSTDPARRPRALASDPARDTTIRRESTVAEDSDDDFEADARSFAHKRNGTPAK